MLLLVVDLGAVEGNDGHIAHQSGLLILALGKGGVVELAVPTRQGLEGVAAADDGGILIGGQSHCGRAPLFSDTGKLVAGNHRSLLINDAYRSVGTILHLKYDALEDPAGHNVVPLSQRAADALSAPQNLCFLLYRVTLPNSIVFFIFFVYNARTFGSLAEKLRFFLVS